MEKDNDIQAIRRYLNGTYQSQEAEQLAESLHRADEEGRLEQLATGIWEEANLQAETSAQAHEQYRREAASLLQTLHGKPHRQTEEKSQSKHFWLKRVVYTTLSLAASFLLFWGGYQLKQIWDLQHMTLACIETGFGEKKEFTLPDGSQIVLNACSQLQYPTRFIGDQRPVKLTGEAYFKVTPNPDQPFRIQTPEFQVEVLGTEFNVKSYANDQIQSVEVESGKVQVDLPEDRIRLKKQEQIYLNRQSGEYSKKKRQENQVAVWRQGTLHFHQTPLADVARELERRFHCRITFQQGQTFDHLISGEHESQSLESILESLSYVCGIQYEKKGEEIILYK